MKRTYLLSTILLTSLALGVGCSVNAEVQPTETTGATSGSGGGTSGSAGGSDTGGGGGESPFCVIIDKDIVKDTTLGADDCYVVEGDRDVTAELTIEPGVTLHFDAGASLSIDDNGGALIANGTAAEPIVFTGTQAVAGFWKGVMIRSNSPLNSMKFVTVEYGGNEKVAGYSSTAAANLYIYHEARLVLEDCSFNHGAALGLGIYKDKVDITSFARNTFAGNQGAPIRLPANHVTVLDAASDFVGGPGMENGEPNIVVINNDLTVNSTWLDHWVPYLFDNDAIYVEADLTLKPGVMLIFPEDGRMIVDGSGSLNAVGTADNAISFTSTTKVAGYWRGVHVASSSPLNVLEYVDIGYGGRSKITGCGACDPANILLYYAPSRLTITHSNIHDSLGWGVYVPGDGTLTDTANTYSSNTSGDVNFVQ